MKAKKKYNKGGKIDPIKKVKRPSSSAVQDQTAQASNLVIRANMTENLENKDKQELGRRIYNTAYKTKAIPERGFKGYGDVEGATKMETEDYYAQRSKEMGIDKIKTYSKGGSFEEKANKGNDAAKYLETGKGPDGMPLSARTRAMYKAIAKKNKNIHLMSPAPFEDDGVRRYGGMMPKKKRK